MGEIISLDSFYNDQNLLREMKQFYAGGQEWCKKTSNEQFLYYSFLFYYRLVITWKMAIQAAVTTVLTEQSLIIWRLSGFPGWARVKNSRGKYNCFAIYLNY